MVNKKIIKVLKMLEILRRIQGSEYSANALMTGVNNIETLDFELNSGEEARENLSGIGKKISSYIDQILSGKYERGIYELEKLDDETYENIKKMYKAMKEHGTGFYKAYKKVFGKVHESMVDESEEESIPEEKERIPRELVKKFSKKLKKIAKELGIKYKITGSYRRKIKTVGDIDVILFNSKNEYSDKDLLDSVLQELELTDELMHGNTMFQGTIYLSEEYPNARIDVTSVSDKDSIPYLLLHSTGNVGLNIKMSSIARKKGWKLSKHKMTDEKGKKIKVSSEKEIFELLGMEYLKPEERNL